MKSDCHPVSATGARLNRRRQGPIGPPTADQQSRNSLCSGEVDDAAAPRAVTSEDLEREVRILEAAELGQLLRSPS